MLDTSPNSPPDRAPLRMALVVTAVAFALRWGQWWLQQADPLFWNPLGGNLPYLLLGERIAAGEWLPLDGRPFTISSPLYPWIVAAVFGVAGEADVGAVRFAGAGADALTCGLLALLARRRFGAGPGWATGLLAALYAPLIHFSVELAPVPFTLLLLVAGLLAIDVGWRGAATGAGDGGGAGEGEEANRGAVASGIRSAALLLAGATSIGLAVGTRPNLLLGAVLLPWVPLLTSRDRANDRDASSPRGSAGSSTGAPPTSEPGRMRAGRASALLASGLLLGIAPIPILNAVSSGRFVPLTTGAGHNFYIGHNPQAQPQYALPLTLDGDIFESMKALAEEEIGRPMEDTEVSGWYLRRALRSMASDPGREVRLLADRILLSVNDFEATTYSSFEYQEHWSPLLRTLPGFALLFGLALAGVAVRGVRRDDLLLWIPFIAGFGSVVLFFYIARLRILVAPTLLILAGIGIHALILDLRSRSYRAAGVLAALLLVGGALSMTPRLTPDPSNEWNKGAGVLMNAGFHEDAEFFLQRSLEANPANPNGWRSIARLYRETGRPEMAEEAEARATALLMAVQSAEEAFRRPGDARDR